MRTPIGANLTRQKLANDELVLCLGVNSMSVQCKLAAAWEGTEKDEIQQLVLALKQALPGATIEETGDRATMPYGSGAIQLVKEHGLWKIEDFD